MDLISLICVIFLSTVTFGYPASINSVAYPFYARADWGAIPTKDTSPLPAPAPYVVIHHTYIPGACHDKAACSKAMRSMQNYHNGLGWGDIGYNFCVGSEGGVYEGRGWRTRGIHAGQANGVSVGICLIGDWRDKAPSDDQLKSTKALILEGVKRGHLSTDYKLIGHNQVMNTECPGRALYSEISTWLHYSDKGMEHKSGNDS